METSWPGKTRPKTVWGVPAPAPMGPKAGQATRPAPEFDHSVPPAESEYSSYCSESVLLDMNRLPAAVCVPRPRPTFTPVEPLVQRTVPVVVTSRATRLLG